MPWVFVEGVHEVPKVSKEDARISIEELIQNNLVTSVSFQNDYTDITIAPGVSFRLKDEELGPFLLGMEYTHYRYISMVVKIPQNIRDMLSIFMVI